MVRGYPKVGRGECRVGGRGLNPYNRAGVQDNKPNQLKISSNTIFLKIYAWGLTAFRKKVSITQLINQTMVGLLLHVGGTTTLQNEVKPRGYPRGTCSVHVFEH